MTPRHRTPRRTPWPALVTLAAVIVIATPAVAAEDVEPVTYTPATCDDPEGVHHVPDNTDDVIYLNHGDPDVPAKGYWAAHDPERLDDADEGVIEVWAYDFSEPGLDCGDTDGSDEAPGASEVPKNPSEGHSSADAELPNTGRSW